MTGTRTILLVATLATAPLAAQQHVAFVDDSFDDFADGHVDAAGHNLYVSRDGAVRTIHRFDLDQDGHLDLLFNGTHDLINFVPATLGRIGQGRRPIDASLPVEGSIRVALDDLDRDGFLDAVFSPNDSGLQQPRRSLTILWGGPDEGPAATARGGRRGAPERSTALGWSGRRMTAWLPTFRASAVVTGDVDRDGWPDIVSLNGEPWLPGQPEGRIVRVFTGGPAGFELTRRHDLGVEGAADLAAGDFDGDGHREVAVLTTTPSVRFVAAVDQTPTISSVIVPLPATATPRALTAADLTGDGRADLAVVTDGDVLHWIPATDEGWGSPRRVTTGPATHVAAGDLDGDGSTDLVVTRFEPGQSAGGEAGEARRLDAPVRVIWGDGDGFATGQPMALDVPSASASAIGDLDADGHADLAVAVYQGDTRFDAASPVFFGTGGRALERSASGFATTGATWVAIAPASNEIPSRVVFANAMGGTLGERVPLHLYWGGPDGFDPSGRVDIPFRSGYESTAADLDADGHVDLVAMNSQHAGDTTDDPTAGANIFWGAIDGFDFEARRTVLAERKLGSSSVADLDRDGYLDLVLGAFESPVPPDRLVIYYGSATGFSRDRRAELPSNGRTIGSVLADLDGDGWLDITVVSSYTDQVHVFLGGPDGYAVSRQWHLPVPFAISAEVADFDADGHLDLVVGSYQDPSAARRDTGLMIFWGSDAGLHQSNAQWLPGAAPIGMVVADFDADGHLDLFSPHYLGELSRESLPSYLYWGSADGFSARSRTILVADSAHDGLAGDFDGDGRLDLAVSSHTRDGDHATVSRVFYNDGDRFRSPRVQELPTVGSHWMWDQDMGHIAHRRWEQRYESSVFEWGTSRTGARLTATADRPGATELRFEIRSAPTEAALSAADWQPVREGAVSLSPDHRALQYRATLVSDNGDRYPVLHRVEVELDADP